MNTELFDRLGEPARMRELAGYDLLNPDLRTSLDAVAQRSATLLEAPVSLVSVILESAQFILGSHGVSGWVAAAQGTPAEWAMCTYTVLAGEPYCITDGRSDPRHSGNPFLQLTGLVSYLGVPLLGAGGHILGAHCVIDARPRIFTDVDLAVITDGAEKVMRLLHAYRTG
ncbi:GAF domain-containing protein [Actinoplanes aureus]|uniref:GAF domain-containing protein n=1 Tax=Actinoplanes aureus TaxID=2792083 RepID=A0A931CA97_9ACTN|nr:GAF domain-containing protein [Actinoplanes aureus]MBG0562886.1 GAF domain-containing protein [Actinoplanes aureus]